MITLELAKQAFKSKQAPLVLIIGGLLLIFLALFEFDGFKQRETLVLINWLSLTLGIALVLWGAFWHNSITQGDSLNTNNYRFKKISDDKYLISINQGGEHSINIIYGNISDMAEYDKKTLVVLPANDKFDDDCIDDTSSVLGAFIHALYPNNKEEIKAELAKKNPEKFEIGKWKYMYDVKYQTTSFNIGIVAVTHLEKDGSIIAYTENVISAFKGINKILNEKRLSKVFVPLIGSGHGGLSPEVSLLCLLLSILDGLKSEKGRKLREVNIVIYKNSNGKKDMPNNTMKGIVKFVLTYFK